MKSVLISIKPKYCELIANGKKTIEVRKTKPKLQTPFKSYIYCTKASNKYQTICGSMVLNSDELYRHPKRGIEYGNSIELMLYDNCTKDNFLNGKVIGEFICDGIISHCEMANADIAEQQGKIKREDLLKYANGKELYGWYISDLKIYDKPKELSKFIKCTYPFDCCACDFWDSTYLVCAKPIRPPQSWCYVEELQE